MIVYRFCQSCDKVFNAELERTDTGFKLVCPYCGKEYKIEPPYYDEYPKPEESDDHDKQ